MYSRAADRASEEHRTGQQSDGNSEQAKNHPAQGVLLQAQWHDAVYCPATRTLPKENSYTLYDQPRSVSRAAEYTLVHCPAKLTLSCKNTAVIHTILPQNHHVGALPTTACGRLFIPFSQVDCCGHEVSHYLLSHILDNTAQPNATETPWEIPASHKKLW